MRRCFHKNKILNILSFCFAIFFLISQTTAGNAQNPFDIKSRSLIDTTTTLPAPDSIKATDTDRQSLPSPTELSSSPEIPLPDSDETQPKESGAPDILQESAPTAPLTDGENTRDDSTRLLGMSSPVDSHGTSGGSTETSWWYYLYDLVLLLFLLGAFLYDRKIFPPLKKAFLHENFLRFLYRDTYLRKPGIFLYLNIIFLLSLGFILYRIAEYFDWATGIKDYLLIQGVVFLLFFIKHISLQLLASLVDKPFEIRFYRYWMILSAGLIGLWLIPVALMISVLPSKYIFIALVICCIPLILLLIYRQIKAMVQAKFFLSKHFFHFFLYFCAVEVVPVLILADILVNY